MERQGPTWVDVGPRSLRVSGAARHDIDFGPSGAHCLVLESVGPEQQLLRTPRFLAADSYLARIAGRLARVLVSTGPSRSLDLDGLQAEIWAQVGRRLKGRRTTAPPPWLARAWDALHDSGGRSSVTHLAELVGTHRVHLARAFRDHFGVSVTECARRLRVSAACRLIAHGQLPLSQAAVEAGFADQSHLTRAIRSYLATTPGALRRAMLHRFKTGMPASR
jgi:AraC-like DNA-binding protein